MATIVPPPSNWQLPDSHPDLPDQGDNEDTVEYIGRLADFLTETPPAAPPGFVLIPCDATPRHFPEYHVAENTFYPAPCSACQLAAAWEESSRLRCERDHQRWKSWRIWQRISSRLYVLGITSSGGGVSYGRCEFCGIGRQHSAPHWRGRRPYILGMKREVWYCLLRRGHRYRLHYPSGLCSICCPCPECGSTDQNHYTCEVAA